MPSDAHSVGLLDAAKASASKLKDRQSALDARARELDALKARLEEERADLESRAAKITADAQAIGRERQALDDTRASMEKDLASINEGRDRLTKDEERLHREREALGERDRSIKAAEERVERLEQAFASQMADSESKLHALLERAEEQMKAQTKWLEAFESRETELHAIREEMHARQNEIVRQHDSLAALKDSFKEELNRLLAEHEALASKEKSILEAEKYLASALQIAESDLAGEEKTAPPMPVQSAPEPVEEPTSAEPTPSPGPVATPEEMPVQEEIAEQPDAKPRSTKEEAVSELARAIEAWKRARNAGWKVSDIRKTVKLARDAIDAGDYAGAIAFAAEILDGLKATPTAR
jgi:chromosome segregation ATPase